MGLLTGQARTANVIAETDVLCYRLDKSGFDAILRARPELVDGLSKVVAKRQAENDATLQAADADARARMAVSRASSSCAGSGSSSTSQADDLSDSAARERDPRASAGRRCRRADGVGSHTNGSRGNAVSTASRPCPTSTTSMPPD